MCVEFFSLVRQFIYFFLRFGNFENNRNEQHDRQFPVHFAITEYFCVIIYDCNNKDNTGYKMEGTREGRGYRERERVEVYNQLIDYGKHTHTHTHAHTKKRGRGS